MLECPRKDCERNERRCAGENGPMVVTTAQLIQQPGVFGIQGHLHMSGLVMTQRRRLVYVFDDNNNSICISTLLVIFFL